MRQGTGKGYMAWRVISRRFFWYRKAEYERDNKEEKLTNFVPFVENKQQVRRDILSLQYAVCTYECMWRYNPERQHRDFTTVRIPD
jgi:hypothetical protein